MTDGQKRLSKRLKVTAFLTFLTALILIILLRLFETESFLEWYNKYADKLMEYRNWVEQLGNDWLTIVVILLNYVLKATIPWVPLTLIMFMSGLVFKWYIAVGINLVGLIILFTIKYYWGRKWGGGNAEKILKHFDNAHLFVDNGKFGSKLVLFGARATPLMPVNSISQLYGTTTMPFIQYLVISIVGFSYKLFSYTIIARNIYDPLSSKFIIPITVLLVISGVILMSINGVVTATSPLLTKLSEKKGLKRNE